MLKDIFQVSKAACASVVFALLYSLIFAAVVGIFSIPSAAIMPVNQVFKVFAVAFGGLLFIRGERGLLKGVVLGISAAVQMWMLFSAIACSFQLGWTQLLEALICAFAGGITGVLAVNLRRA